MNLIKTVTTAKTSKMWMSPPNVQDVATPKIHKASMIMKIAPSISFFSERLDAGKAERGWNRGTRARGANQAF